LVQFIEETKNTIPLTPTGIEN